MKRMIFVLLAVLCFMPFASAGAEDTGQVTIAVIDTGIAEKNSLLDYAHILSGISYVDGISSCRDRLGHGTAIAGILQEYAPGASLLPMMYYTKYASGVPQSGGIKAICRAIYDAVDSYRCKIINISSGIYTEDEELKAAIEYAESKNVIVVSAVGNDNKVEGGRVYYPAAYPTVIGVGAVDADENIADFSQRNSSVMAVMPGVDVEVVSIKNSEDYTEVSGTSYAAAAVCGIAAEAAGRYPKITPEELRTLIKLSCRDLGTPGYDVSYGYGILDKDLLLKNLERLRDGALSLM